MLRIDNLIRFTLASIFRERALQLNATFTEGMRPYRDARVRIVTEPISAEASVGYALERRLKGNGEISERIQYGRSFVRIDLIGDDLMRRSGFVSVAVSMYRPGRSYEYISFKMDTSDFFTSEIEHESKTGLEILFNSRQDCALQSLMVMTAGIPPVVASPKKGGNIAYYERYGFGRYVLGLDLAQYLASWGAFFPEPKEPGDTLEVEFIVTIEPPLDFIIDMEASGGEDDEAHSDAWAERIVTRYQLEEEPSMENEDCLEFRFRREITITRAMLGIE